MDGSWETFKLVEVFKDAWGSWSVMDVLGAPIVELPDALKEDLLTWSWLARCMRKQKDDESKGKV